MTNYGTKALFEAYVEEWGHTLPDGDARAALVRGSFDVDGRYETALPGLWRVCAGSGRAEDGRHDCAR
ncbi:hypothetical protein CO661_02305 [Sinorhizobium fredii]|uniref:Uncharacterized protein n=1 Tax=Rhizobium fredii TaxID=380 RepID=A0A2A6M7U9_RHIFR|nr:hypothetical protein CO661_02305 [Sinorhizobium fredii]